MEEDKIKKAVRESYAKVATGSSCGCDLPREAAVPRLIKHRK